MWEEGEVGPGPLGRCYGFPSRERRQVFDAWHAYMGAPQPADRFDEEHVGHLVLLIAQWKRYQGVQVTFRAEIHDLEDEEQQRCRAEGQSWWQVTESGTCKAARCGAACSGKPAKSWCQCRFIREPRIVSQLS